ncbi:MAG: hypothetical protein RLY31_1372 [Bacteroidota bacterium]|jgi:mono/diheme cytochrome c family protein
MKAYVPLAAIILALALLPAFTGRKTIFSSQATGRVTVADVLRQLGDKPAPHLPDYSLPGVDAAKGLEIMRYGQTTGPGGETTQRVSRHFVCTSCHNIQRDEPDLSRTDPMARLRYVAENGLPFLQGSALYGIVDRRRFYNGDYYRKYGDLVKAAQEDLREAVQLCATECAQGRPLTNWEMESVLASLWEIGLTVDDLQLDDRERRQLQSALQAGHESERPAAIALLKSKYLPGMPATFLDPPADRKAGFPTQGDPATGRLLYELSCLHCHSEKRYAFFNLEDTDVSLRFLHRHFPTYSRYSVYQVARYGTPPIPWKRAYMPHYTKEKMSEQMLEDLRAYIRQEASGG